jgi:exonuclease VII small subunit
MWSLNSLNPFRTSEPTMPKPVELFSAGQTALDAANKNFDVKKNLKSESQNEVKNMEKLIEDLDKDQNKKLQEAQKRIEKFTLEYNTKRKKYDELLTQLKENDKVHDQNLKSVEDAKRLAMQLILIENAGGDPAKLVLMPGNREVSLDIDAKAITNVDDNAAGTSSTKVADDDAAVGEKRKGDTADGDDGAASAKSAKVGAGGAARGGKGKKSS